MIDNNDMKKGKELTSNRLYTSNIININNTKAVIKRFHDNLNTEIIAGILDDFIIFEPVNNLEDFARILKYQISDNNKHRFFIRNYIEGITLRELAENNISTDQAVDICISIAMIMSQMEKISLFHGSLTPNNIIIKPDNSICILDPYINKTRYPNINKYSDIASFDLCFLPTEFFIKEGELNIVSDIYSIGCIFYFLITNSLPYYSELNENIMKNHIWSSPKKKTPFDNLINYILSPNIDTRPQSMAELINILQSFKSNDTAPDSLKGSAPEEEFQHHFLLEILKAHISASDIYFNFNNLKKFSRLYICKGSIKFIECENISDCFLNYLIHLNILPSNIVDELFPFLNDRVELINKISKMDFVDHDEINHHYEQWLLNTILNEIINKSISFDICIIDNKDKFSLPAFDGLYTGSLLYNIWNKYNAHILEESNIYTEIMIDQNLSVSSPEDIPEDIRLSSFEISIFSTIARTPSYNEIIEMNPGKTEETKTAILKLLFLSILKIQKPVLQEKEKLKTFKKVPSNRFGSLRKKLKENDSPNVMILKQEPQKSKEESISNTHSEVPEPHPKPQHDKDQNHELQSRPSRNLSKTGIIEQKKIIAATLLQEAKEHHNNIRFTDANETISEALKIAPNNGTLLHWKAKILIRIPDEKVNAGEYFEKALKKEPDNTEILEDYCIYLHEKGDRISTIRVLNRLLKINPHSEKGKEIQKAIEKEKGGNSFIKKIFS